MKKAFDIIKKVVVGIILAVAILMMLFTLVSVNTFDKHDRNIFGYKFYIVRTDSMKATDFAAGDVIITKEVDPGKLKKGDIITFISQNDDSFGETITHKIYELVEEDGEKGFRTYGTTKVKDIDGNGKIEGIDEHQCDETIVTYPYVLGQYKMHFPKMGTFFAFLKTTPGYIICILIPFLLLILSQGLNTISLFRRYKKEQMAEMLAEKEKIEQDKVENQKMMAELLALKQQLEAQSAAKSAESTPEPVEVAVEENAVETAEETAKEASVEAEETKE